MTRAAQMAACVDVRVRRHRRAWWNGLFIAALAWSTAGAQNEAGTAVGDAGLAAATGSVEAGQAKAATCAACHGIDGNSVTPDWPVLAGQHASYIAKQLRAFQSGERTDVQMTPFAMMLTEQDILDVAAYFAAQAPAPKGADPELVSLGQQIYRGGVPDRGIAACIACHGPRGHGNPLAAYPKINGQHAAYTAKTLNAYAAGERRSDADVNQMMRNVAEMLLQDEIRALASYVQGLR